MLNMHFILTYMVFALTHHVKSMLVQHAYII